MTAYPTTDVEQALQTAFEANDTDAIAYLERVVDSLANPAPSATLHASALWYVGAGLKVFPLTPGTKIPLKFSGGCLDATTDPNMVDKWWGGNPHLNIGIATGHLVDVVDIDGLVGHESRATHWDMFKNLDVVGVVSTPRPGGVHLFVPAAPDRGNKAGLLPGIDYRGSGGYIVAPPSVNDQGRYVWVRPLDVAKLGGAA